MSFLAPVRLLFTERMIGPDFKAPAVAVSDNWLETRDRRVSTGSATYRNWWTTFDDPVLNRLVERAYGENLSLRQAGVRVLQARAHLGIARGDVFPQTQRPSSPSRTSPRASSESIVHLAASGRSRKARI